MASASVFVRRAMAGARALSRTSAAPLASRQAAVLSAAVPQRQNGAAFVPQRGLFNMSLREWAFKSAGYNQYGLYYDDCLYENEDVKEAIRRLPPTLQVGLICLNLTTVQNSAAKGKL